MQVARNVYLSSEKTYTRKIYEILLTFKLEHLLSKEQILEIYMNQIYLGNRAYGFAAASEAYFGKPLKDITVAEAAMLAGLPKAPSAYNPISNPKRAHIRQLYIIERMEENGFITAQQAEQARAEPLQLKSTAANTRVHAEYVAEMVRQLIFAQYGNDAYTRGLNVYTTSMPVNRKLPTRRCARASWTTSAARSTAAPRSSSPCPPTHRSRKTPSTTPWPTTPTTATCWPPWCWKPRPQDRGPRRTARISRSRAMASSPCNPASATRHRPISRSAPAP
jgi:hypothetical protein